MDKLKEVNSSRKCLIAAAALLFLFMLLLNGLTPYVADDYAYMISFYDQWWIENLMDVVYSMYVHSFTMNGRIISHAFGQAFMIWPKFVFNLCNALVYVALMYFLYRVANFKRKRNLLLFAGICMSFWFFMPVFGQVALWQLGSVNYLWALLAGIFYLFPFVYRFVYRRELLPKLWQKVLFCLFALPLGMYTEITSFIALFLGAVLLLLTGVVKKESLKSWLVFPVVIAAAGYLLLMSMPAEKAAKQSSISISVFLSNFVDATNMLKAHGLVLLLVWIVLFVLGIYEKASAERLWLSGLFCFGAVSANYMLTVAKYYPERCICTTITLLILACAVLIPELIGTRVEIVCACGGSVLLVAFAFSLLVGTYDIWQSHRGFVRREAAVQQHIEAGELDIALPLIIPSTQYSAYWGLADLSTETAQTWPNNYMATYYGLKSILGEE